MKKLVLIGAASLLTIGYANAETTVIHRDAGPPAVGVVVGAPPVEHRTTVVKGGAGCEHKTVHKENELGESKTVKKTTCD